MVDVHNKVKIIVVVVYGSGGHRSVLVETVTPRFLNLNFFYIKSE